MFWVIYIVLPSVQVCVQSQVLLLFTSVLVIPHLAKFWRIHNNLASPSLLKLSTLQSQLPRNNIIPWKCWVWSPISFFIQRYHYIGPHFLMWWQCHPFMCTTRGGLVGGDDNYLECARPPPGGGSRAMPPKLKK